MARFDGRLKLDLASAYTVSAAKIGGWAVVTAIVFRHSPPAFALLVLIRGTLGILNHTAAGLGPAMAHRVGAAAGDGRIDRGTYRAGLFAAALASVLGLALVAIYAGSFDALFDRPLGPTGSVALAVWGVGLALVLRLAGDVPGAAIQTTGRIALDNAILIIAEFIWVAVAMIPPPAGQPLAMVMGGLLAGALWSLGARLWVAGRLTRSPGAVAAPLGPVVRALLAYGAMVTLATLSDYLYAPTDYWLINRLLDPLQVAVYAPAVQIDTALVVLVWSVAIVVLPRAAAAHGLEDLAAVRWMYVRGTVVATGVLIVAAAAVLLGSRWILRTWLGDEMDATRAILPWVMIHTVAGGSSAVGRAVLLGTGRAKAFMAAAVLAGAANVGLSAGFAWGLGMGLRGIILGTIVVVVGRCAIWMPWYVLRITRAAPTGGGQAPGAEAS